MDNEARKIWCMDLWTILSSLKSLDLLANHLDVFLGCERMDVNTVDFLGEDKMGLDLRLEPLFWKLIQVCFP